MNRTGFAFGGNEMSVVIEENEYPGPTQRDHRRNIREMSAKVSTIRKEGITAHGFPSTANQGKFVKQIKDHDPTIENPNLVSKENYIQSSIKEHRREMKE